MAKQCARKAELGKRSLFRCDSFDFVPDAVVALDVRGRVIAWNHHMEAMTGVEAGNILHKGDFACGLPFYGCRRPILGSLVLSPHEEFEKCYSVLRKEAEDVWIGEADILGKEGAGRTVWAKASTLRDPEGRIVGVVEIVKDITEKKHTLRQLVDARIALKVLLEQRDRDRTDLQADVIANVQSLVFPYIARLRRKRLPLDQIGYLDLIESNLNAIVSPFLRNATVANRSLTRREIEIANFIRQGRSTKQIAELLDLSPRSVDFHRSNLRRKLGVGSTRENLTVVLRSLALQS